MLASMIKNLKEMLALELGLCSDDLQVMLIDSNAFQNAMKHSLLTEYHHCLPNRSPIAQKLYSIKNFNV